MGKIKTYYIRLNCIGFQDFAIKAKTEEDAINHARNHFSCDNTENSFSETLDELDSNHCEVEEVYYPEESNHA